MVVYSLYWWYDCQLQDSHALNLGKLCQIIIATHNSCYKPHMKPVFTRPEPDVKFHSLHLGQYIKDSTVAYSTLSWMYAEIQYRCGVVHLFIEDR